MMFMKITILIAGISFAFLSAFAQSTHEAKITIHVVDESGKPVTNAPVRTSSVLIGNKMGSEFGEEPDYKDITVLTDADGNAVITTANALSPFQFMVINHPGYYFGAGEYNFKESSIAGQWQPWNPTVELVLKAVGVQVPMYARQVWNQKIPDQGKPVGFDLVAGDWMPPYGKGTTADFIFQLDSTITKTITNTAPTYNGTRTWTRPVYDNRLTLRFSDDGDGIQSMTAIASGLRSPRSAPAEGYQPELNKRDWLELTTNKVNMPHPAVFTVAHSDNQQDANYFFRVRTKKDENGTIVSALYGKIYGDISLGLIRGDYTIKFTYYLNPEPNSRNMEFDSTKNLFKDLKPMEQVTAP